MQISIWILQSKIRNSHTSENLLSYIIGLLKIAKLIKLWSIRYFTNIIFHNKIYINLTHSIENY